MKRFFLGAFIMIDLALIGGSGYVLYKYVSGKMHVGSALGFSQPVGSSVATAPKPAAGGLLATPAPSVESSTRKILFSYRNPHARQVSIRADFTGWKAESMQKGAKGVWTYPATLTPGEYAYCFTVDDKTFKDPANKRTKVIGRTTVSAIMVEARPAKAVK